MRLEYINYDDNITTAKFAWQDDFNELKKQFDAEVKKLEINRRINRMKMWKKKGRK